jgi:hypothetical protein
MSGWTGRLEQVLGACLVLLVLTDMFITVFYARVKMGIVSERLSLLIWRLFLRVTKVFSRKRLLLLGFGGPAVILSLVPAWALGLTLGVGLFIHPAHERAGAEEYVALRAQWDRYVRTLAPALDYRMDEIDPAITRLEHADQRLELPARLHPVG